MGLSGNVDPVLPLSPVRGTRLVFCPPPLVSQYLPAVEYRDGGSSEDPYSADTVRIGPPLLRSIGLSFPPPLFAGPFGFGGFGLGSHHRHGVLKLHVQPPRIASTTLMGLANMVLAPIPLVGVPRHVAFNMLPYDCAAPAYPTLLRILKLAYFNHNWPAKLIVDSYRQLRYPPPVFNNGQAHKRI